MSANEDKFLANSAAASAAAAATAAGAVAPKTLDVVTVVAPGAGYTSARRLIAGAGASLDVATPGQIVVAATTANVSSGAYAARPAAGVSGRQYVCTDSPVQRWYDNGTAWKPCLPDSAITATTEVSPAVVAAIQAYTLIKCGSSSGNITLTDYKGAAWVYADPVGVGLFYKLLLTTPPAATWKLRAAFWPYGPTVTGTNMTVGFGFMESVSTKGQVFYISSGGSYGGYTAFFAPGGVGFNASLTFQIPAGSQSDYAAGIIWFEIEQTATQWIYRFGRDGLHWIDVMTMNRSGAFVPTPDRVGFFLNPDSTGCGMTLFSYSLTATP